MWKFTSFNHFFTSKHGQDFDPWVVTMADDFGFGIVEAEALQKLYHRAQGLSQI